MAQLPPKVPTMAQNWAPFPHHRMPNFSSIAVINHPASPPPPSQQQHCWMDEFLDFSTARRGAHRRSASDSIAFMESPLNVLDVDDGRIINSAVHGTNNIAGSTFDRLDDEQLMSMFSDDIAVPPPPTIRTSSNPSSPSDHNSNNDEMMMTANNNGNENNASNIQGQGFDHRPLMQLRIDGHQQQPKSEPGEVDSLFDPNDPHSLSPSGPPPISPADPKRVKRILANRQSAQRSRVRKLQYISELERSVTSLQSEVSELSPRVAFLDHQRLILNVDNSALKQRIAALAQDKLFKDAHQEALKKEIERLRQVYHHQTINKNMDNNDNNNNQNPAAAAPAQQHHNPANIMHRTDHNKEPQQILG